MLPRLLDIQASQQRFDAIVIGWTPVGPAPDLAASTLKIERAYTQTDGFTEIARVPLSSVVYIDVNHNKQQKWVSVYYRLTVIKGAESKVYDTLVVGDVREFIDRKMVQAINTYLRNNGAVPCLIYQQAYGPEATRCAKCWDPVTQHAIYSNCSACAGTTYIGTVKGYYTPVLTLVDLKPTPANNSIEDTLQSPNTTECRMGCFPILRPGDLIRETNTGNMWYVVSTNRQIRSKTLVSQDPVILRQIKPSDVQYTLPVPTTLTPVLKRHRAVREKILVNNSKTEAQFIEVVV